MQELLYPEKVGQFGDLLFNVIVKMNTTHLSIHNLFFATYTKTKNACLKGPCQKLDM